MARHFAVGRARLTSSWTALRKSVFSRKLVTLWIIVLVNVAIAILYIWTRGGATTVVRIEAMGNYYQAYVDGEFALERTFSGRPQGGIGFLLPQENRLPGLPSPYGVDWVRVTDAATGDVLFEDSFDSSPSSLWQNDGAWRVTKGVFTTDENEPVMTGFQPWGDFVMEAKLRNITEATLYVRAAGPEDAIAFDFGPFRAIGGRSFTKIEDGTEVRRLTGYPLEVSRLQTVRSTLAMLLRPYPYAVLMIIGAACVALVLRVSLLERLIQELDKRIPARTLVLGLAAGTFAVLFYSLYVIGDAMPHVPDSVLYVFQAKIFASMNVTGDAPPVRESFSIFESRLLRVADGRWFSPYPFGHPLFLTVGQVFGAVWLVPPVLGAASVALIYWVGKRIYGVAAGVAATVLLASSPFFLMTASNFMSHNTAAFTIIVALFFITLPGRRRLPAMFVAGVFIGLLFNIRPLTAVAFMPVLGGFMVYELVSEREQRKELLSRDFAFATGALLMFGAYLLYNQLTSGDPLRTTYAVEGSLMGSLGFDGSHSVAFALQDQQQHFSLLLLVANGWPLWIGLTLVVLPFLTGRQNRWDVLFGVSALTIALSTMIFADAGVMHGPRYWYETMPFLILLTARGAQCLALTGSMMGDWLADRVWKTAPQASPGITALAASSLVAGLVVFSLLGWFGQREAWGGEGITTFTPAKASQLEGFNFTDRRLLDLAEDMELEGALVFVEDCGSWYCYGSTFWQNSPQLDGNVVWAELKDTQEDVALLDHYPDRDVYIANYLTSSISAVSAGDISARLEGVARSERHDAIAALTSTPAERDTIRERDMERLRAALESCMVATGMLPDTGDQLTPLSAVLRSGSDCLLQQLLPDVPRDPLGDPVRDGYWYKSSGTEFLLVSLLESSPEQRGCPEGLGQASDSLGRTCLTGSLP